MSHLEALITETDLLGRIESPALLTEIERSAFSDLSSLSERLTLLGHGLNVSYSRKVFIPLTHLCRNVCHYCTFAKAPAKVMEPFLSIDQVLAIAQAGKAQGCREALFTLGDQPELRYAAARDWLNDNGFATTLDYVEAAAKAVVEQTGLLPHLNPGLMNAATIARLRQCSISMGLMLETVSDRLAERGGPHFGSPDKAPQERLATIAAAGEAAVPFTTGLLIGIGEDRVERIASLLAIRDLHDRYGHIQEVIIQNFKAKAGTKMATAPEPSLEEHLWTVAAARLIFGPTISIQAPPNLQPDALQQLIRAGVNDWGGISPVTPDHVNPEAPWPHLDQLRIDTKAAGRTLVERLAIVPGYARQSGNWIDRSLARPMQAHLDAAGLARETDWHAGLGNVAPESFVADVLEARPPSPRIVQILDQVVLGRHIDEDQITALFEARGDDVGAIAQAANRIRKRVVGDTITYVVNRNINYTNICLYKCGFCGFSKGSSRSVRGPAYNIDHAEIVQRTIEARQRGATEVCLQGGIHPDFNGKTYLDIVAAVKAAVPDMHIHAFSPLEILHGATTLGLSLKAFLIMLRDAGLSTLPGTAAEILDDDIRAIICPDKLTTNEWLDVMQTAHSVGLRSTATIMFGHVETARHWARHLVRIRDLQCRTGGFTEFVPLPFVHMEAPMWRKGLARSGPTLREVVLMHAIARLALHGAIDNIQVSWPKLGPAAALLCLEAGANDFGGVLMDESITRSAGGTNGQSITQVEFERLAKSIGRTARQRNTIYEKFPLESTNGEEPEFA